MNYKVNRGTRNIFFPESPPFQQKKNQKNTDTKQDSDTKLRPCILLGNGKQWPNMTSRDNAVQHLGTRLGVEAQWDKQGKVGCVQSYCNINCSTWWYCSRTVFKGKHLTARFSYGFRFDTILCNGHYNTINSTVVWNKRNTMAMLEMWTARKYYVTKKEKKKTNPVFHKMNSLEKAWRVQTPNIWKAAKRRVLYGTPHELL